MCPCLLLLLLLLLPQRCGCSHEAYQCDEYASHGHSEFRCSPRCYDFESGLYSRFRLERKSGRLPQEARRTTVSGSMPLHQRSHTGISYSFSCTIYLCTGVIAHLSSAGMLIECVADQPGANDPLKLQELAARYEENIYQTAKTKVRRFKFGRSALPCLSVVGRIFSPNSQQIVLLAI